MKSLPITLQNLPGNLLEQVQSRTTEEGDCWLWTGALSTAKTPIISLPRELFSTVSSDEKKTRHISVRRLVYAVTKGKDPGTKFVTTTCGEYLCVCPDHIRAVNPKQFSKEMYSKINESLRARKIALSQRKNATTKLTVEKVQEIRQSSLTNRALAEELGVSQSLIGKIRRNQAWREVASPMSYMRELLK